MRRDEEKRASYVRERSEAGRTFVQDGFDARTGDEREPREQPGARESDAPTPGESEREGRSEIARRPTQVEKGRARAAKRRKLKLRYRASKYAYRLPGVCAERVNRERVSAHGGI